MNELVSQDLPYGVYLHTTDTKWTLKAAFASLEAAAGYAVGLNIAEIKSVIYRLENGIPQQEVTDEAMRRFQQATGGR